MHARTDRSIRARIQQSEAWYRGVLEIPHLFTTGTFAFFNCGGVRIYLFQADAGPLHESIIYFDVAGIQETYGALLSRGVAFTNAPHLIHRHDDGLEEWLAFFEDLEGRPLAIMSKVKSGA